MLLSSAKSVFRALRNCESDALLKPAMLVQILSDEDHFVRDQTPESP